MFFAPISKGEFFRATLRKTIFFAPSHFCTILFVRTDNMKNDNRYLTDKRINFFKVNLTICIDSNQLKLNFKRFCAFLNLNTAEFRLAEKWLFINNAHANSQPLNLFKIKNNNPNLTVQNQCLKLSIYRLQWARMKI